MSQKYFYRVDGQNQPIPGTLVRLKEKPLTGKWREVSGNPCCDEPASGGGPTGQEVILRDYIGETVVVSGVISGVQNLTYLEDAVVTVYPNNILKFSNGLGVPMLVQLWLGEVIVNSGVVNNNGYKELGSFVFDTIRIIEA